MRSRLLLLPVLLFAILACAPLQALRSVDWDTLTADAPREQITPPVAPRQNARAIQTPTRALPPLVFNSVPLMVTTTSQENIYLAQDVSATFRQMVIADAGVAAKQLKLELGWTGSRRVSVYVFPSRSAWLQGIAQIGDLSADQVAFQSNLSSDAWITISGVAHPGIYLYPIQQSAFETLHMLSHEYTHAIQQQATDGALSIPDWFLEGMAEAEGWRIAGIEYPADYARVHADVQAFVVAAAKEKRIFPLSSISTQQSWRARLERPRTATLEYAESQMVVEYLQKLKGPSAPMAILREAAADRDFATAFLQTTGMTLAAFETKFIASLSE